MNYIEQAFLDWLDSQPPQRKSYVLPMHLMQNLKLQNKAMEMEAYIAGFEEGLRMGRNRNCECGNIACRGGH